MALNQFYTKYIDGLYSHLVSLDYAKLVNAISLINKCNSQNGKLILVGNGGSAAMCSHVSVDFTKAAKIRAINFNEADLITCFSNDYGYEQWVVEALKSYADPSDLVMLVSSSGASPNIVNAAKYARKTNLDLITFTGFRRDNELKRLGSVNFWANSISYNVVEMVHHIWMLALVDIIVEHSAKK